MRLNVYNLLCLVYPGMGQLTFFNILMMNSRAWIRAKLVFITIEHESLFSSILLLLFFNQNCTWVQNFSFLNRLNFRNVNISEIHFHWTFKLFTSEVSMWMSGDEKKLRASRSWLNMLMITVTFADDNNDMWHNHKTCTNTLVCI